MVFPGVNRHGEQASSPEGEGHCPLEPWEIRAAESAENGWPWLHHLPSGTDRNDGARTRRPVPASRSYWQVETSSLMLSDA